MRPYTLGLIGHRSYWLQYQLSARETVGFSQEQDKYFLWANSFCLGMADQRQSVNLEKKSRKLQIGECQKLYFIQSVGNK